MASNINFAPTQNSSTISMTSIDTRSLAAQLHSEPSASTEPSNQHIGKHPAAPILSSTSPMQANHQMLAVQHPSYPAATRAYQFPRPTLTSLTIGGAPDAAQANEIFGQSEQSNYSHISVAGQHLEAVGSNRREPLNLVSAGTQPNKSVPKPGSVSSTMGHSGSEGGFPIRSAKQSSRNEYGEHTDSTGKEGDDGPAPPWSELKTKAGKERKRLPLACIACRRKKIRCSGEKPACKHCLRSRIPCVYKITTRKAAPRTDYMAMLDKRLKRMEERIIRIVPKDQNKDSRVLERGVIRPGGQTSGNLKATPGKKRAAKDAFGDGPRSLSPSKASQAEVSPNHPLPRLENEEISLMSEGSNSLPTQEMQEYLTEVFFDNLYGQAYHLLHKPSFTRKLKSGNVPPVLVLAICAISSRFAEHPNITEEPSYLRGEIWAAEARNIVMRRYDEPNITIITVLIILGLHEFGSCRGGRSWMFGGMAIRMAYALQLHRELDNDPLGRKDIGESSFIDREIRRRLMWACFSMDRFNSSGTGRPMFVTEDDIKVQLPIKEEFFQMDISGPTESLDGREPNPISPGNGQLSNARENMGVTAYMIRIISLWGRVVQYFNLGGREKDTASLWSLQSNFASLQASVEQFRDQLPETLVYSKENLQAHASERLANQFLFLHIAYSQIILFMNRFAIPSAPGALSPEDMPKEFVQKCGRKAVEAASQISRLLSDSGEHRANAPFIGYCAFLSSTVHIFGIFQKNPKLRITSRRDLETNLEYLKQKKRYWGIFHYMTHSLKELYNQYEGSSRQSSGQSGPMLSPTSTFQYGDWFDQYPHGVQQVAGAGPRPHVKKENSDEAVLDQKPDLQTVEKYFATLSPNPDHGKKVSKKTHPRKSAAMKSGGRISAKSYSQNGSPATTNTPTSQVAGQSLPMQMDESQMGSTASGNLSPHTHMPQNAPQVFGHPQQQAMFPNTGFQFSGGQNALGSMHDVSLSQNQPTILPELDRQLVYDAYAGTDAMTRFHGHDMMGDGDVGDAQGWGPQMDAGSMGNYGLGESATEAMGNSAWFLPFNTNTPWYP